MFRSNAICLKVSHLRQIRHQICNWNLGGFAHVYLVRTATPVYNTTHHVLKRIAVDSEGMLTEVKKEVDVMVRVLLPCGMDE